MIDFKDYYKKIKTYKTDIFSYSDVGKIKIFINLIKLFFYQLFNKGKVKARVNNYKMILDLKTPGLSKTLFVYGKREILDTNLIQKEVGGDMNILDIGANIGYYVLMEASQLNNGKVYAFEPDPRNIELLRENVKLNNFEDKIEIFPYAVSDKNEIKKFNLAERTNVSSFVDRSDNINTVEVECINLDDFEHINEIDFIRMDVEGYEVKVLEGLKKVINSNKPLKIFLEVHSGVYNKNDLNFEKQLENLLSNDFSVKYIISSSIERSESLFLEKGYKPIGQGVETDNVRNFYKDIKSEDVFYLLNNRSIRSLMLER